MTAYLLNISQTTKSCCRHNDDKYIPAHR